ncbi:hypothetical protein COCC4DRAFT_155392 [Bipolaris maydis ATCC 48331]|uniref:Oxidase ustYa n=2 Tax=Cochliobolus heterostrophus TaxID=5016 RepID=M2V1Q3_COCH5|nr:uncharacterized protein COCC4DRAFT_155392 [Bipolaris maydis ATCC 48331]EMD84669.1 hypothetical protein COCHEDRAFT_1122397 [Bipolaris maydis C5]KAJ5028326.1 hypothetical protein J3E73DRAFT_186210 [Bipolaris maydis]EMD93852.1 hypothetical protein COCHEDRAFT_1154422 [Bipolaris maydis C5]ENH98591.1 hypothetical protein COCC4DRAFT_155392 [Bipolaris maydis ATCC 48331]KAJ5030985.1 hypothetical protein J3E73DRAFT_386871 [Bipolaris maydis]
MAERTKYSPLGEEDENDTEKVSLEAYEELVRRLRRLCILCIALMASCVTLGLFLVTNLKPEVSHPLPLSPSLLGEDPTGFVPKEIGGPVEYTTIDENDPYFIKLDTFETLEKVKWMVDRLRMISKCKYTTYMGYDGKMHKLGTCDWDHSNREMYGLRGLHQMHCVEVLLEAYGYRHHGQNSVWEPPHVAHCLNSLREAVSCFADASVVSFLPDNDHIGDGQQFRCRNFSALRQWADESFP